MKRAEKATVLLADGRARRRAAVRGLLERAGLRVCAEAENARGAVRAAVRERPDVSLLDAGLLGDVVAATREIAAHLPDSHIVVLHAWETDGALLATLDAGASGYLPADTDPARLGTIVCRVLAGEAAVPRSLMSIVISDYRRRGAQRRLALELRGRGVELTRREWEVLELIGQELETSEIAERLGIRAVTVRSHAAALLRKLGAPDRATAARLLRR
jgi:DNA-binding NarL/FixJ family response regulator